MSPSERSTVDTDIKMLSQDETKRLHLELGRNEHGMSASGSNSRKCDVPSPTLAACSMDIDSGFRTLLDHTNGRTLTQSSPVEVILHSLNLTNLVDTIWSVVNPTENTEQEDSPEDIDSTIELISDRFERMYDLLKDRVQLTERVCQVYEMTEPDCSPNSSDFSTRGRRDLTRISHQLKHSLQDILAKEEKTNADKIKVGKFFADMSKVKNSWMSLHDNCWVPLNHAFTRATSRDGARTLREVSRDTTKKEGSDDAEFGRG